MTIFWLAIFAAQSASPSPGMLQADSATYATTATSGSIVITITRTQGTTGTVGCSYTTVPGTAIAGTDYTTTSGTLSWGGGFSGVRTVTIPILNDGVVNGNKTFSLQLHTPTGFANLGVAPSVPLKDQEGRVLGSLPAIAAPIDWPDTSTAVTGMDAVMSALQLLPLNSPWNEDISGLSVHANSANIIGFMGASDNFALNRDMNFVIVPNPYGTISVPLTLYASQSNPGPYPIPPNAPIEGWKLDDTRTLLASQMGTENGDRHCMILDPVAGRLFEFWQMRRTSGTLNTWTAANEATFNIHSNNLRNAGWTSGDAAGLPIMPAIPRFDECERGLVAHAMRFTSRTKLGYIYPATHDAAVTSDPNAPVMGQRFRLKNNAGVTTKINAMGVHAKAIAKGLQKYGMFMADNGGDWRLSAGADARMTASKMSGLTALIGSDFEVVNATLENGGPRATSTTVITISDGGGGGGGDLTAPTIAIGTPNSSPTYSTSSASLLFAGTASDNVGVSYVSWTNAAGGSGTATGTTSWSSLITLVAGSNVLTFTAHDAGGNVTSDVITVTYTPPVGGSGGGGGGGGGCGLLGLEILLLRLLRRRN